MANASDAPEGFRYRSDFLTAAEEEALVARLSELPLREFEFHGYLARRRVLAFGWRYDFAGAALERADEIPDFLLPLRERAAVFAGLAPQRFGHALVTEYAPGAAIGWHKDKGVFDVVVGVSLLSSCVFRLRRRQGERWERRSLTLAPRSAYLLAGAVRSSWEHSIPAVPALRYSITLRSLRPGVEPPPDETR